MMQQVTSRAYEGYYPPMLKPAPHVQRPSSSKFSDGLSRQTQVKLGVPRPGSRKDSQSQRKLNSLRENSRFQKVRRTPQSSNETSSSSDLPLTSKETSSRYSTDVSDLEARYKRYGSCLKMSTPKYNNHMTHRKSSDASACSSVSSNRHWTACQSQCESELEGSLFVQETSSSRHVVRELNSVTCQIYDPPAAVHSGMHQPHATVEGAAPHSTPVASSFSVVRCQNGEKHPQSSNPKTVAFQENIGIQASLSSFGNNGSLESQPAQSPLFHSGTPKMIDKSVQSPERREQRLLKFPPPLHVPSYRESPLLNAAANYVDVTSPNARTHFIRPSPEPPSKVEHDVLLSYTTSPQFLPRQPQQQVQNRNHSKARQTTELDERFSTLRDYQGPEHCYLPQSVNADDEMSYSPRTPLTTKSRSHMEACAVSGELARQRAKISQQNACLATSPVKLHYATQQSDRRRIRGLRFGNFLVLVAIVLKLGVVVLFPALIYVVHLILEREFEGDVVDQFLA